MTCYAAGSQTANSTCSTAAGTCETDGARARSHRSQVTRTVAHCRQVAQVAGGDVSHDAGGAGGGW